MSGDSEWYTTSTTLPATAYATNTHRNAVSASPSRAFATSAGTPAASAPMAPKTEPTNAYLANIDVRPRSVVVDGSNDCSMGANTLTSPLEGFNVPMTPTTTNTAKVVDV